MAGVLTTVGHGTLDAARFTELLCGAGITALVDVRTAPGSRHNPDFRRAAMERWLPDAGVEYRWEQRLGGFRRGRADSPNLALRHPAFRGYADHMQTDEFHTALAGVLQQASTPTAVMCAESVWWRCHRRLIADAAALLHDVEVRHLMHDGTLRPHLPTEGVRRDGDVLVYDGGAQLALPEIAG